MLIKEEPLQVLQADLLCHQGMERLLCWTCLKEIVMINFYYSQ